MKRLLLLLFVCFIFVGCTTIVPTVSSQELEDIEKTANLLCDEYSTYIENDIELDEMSKEIRLETPETLMESIRQLLQIVRETEADGFIKEEDNGTEDN